MEPVVIYMLSRGETFGVWGFELNPPPLAFMATHGICTKPMRNGSPSPKYTHSQTLSHQIVLTLGNCLNAPISSNVSSHISNLGGGAKLPDQTVILSQRLR